MGHVFGPLVNLKNALRGISEPDRHIESRKAFNSTFSVPPVGLEPTLCGF